MLGLDLTWNTLIISAFVTGCLVVWVVVILAAVAMCRVSDAADRAMGIKDDT